MLTTTLRVLFIAHGLVHFFLTAVPIPNDPASKPGDFFTATSRSWLLPKLGLRGPGVHWLGIGLVALTTVGCVTAGLAMLGEAGTNTIWRMVTFVSASLSLLLLIIFWHAYFLVGMLLDIEILIGLL